MASSATPSGRPASREEGRALALGPLRTFALALIGLAAIVGALALIAGHGGRVASPTGKYGGLPAWLPKATIPVGRIVHASPTHSILAIEGDTVAVDLQGANSLVTAVGPRVPETGKFPVPATSPCTFVITFAQTKGSIPLQPTDFTIRDEEGRVHHPAVTSLHGGAPPSRVATGKPVSLKVYAVLPTGSGSLDWTPRGRRPIVSWDFEVEID